MTPKPDLHGVATCCACGTTRDLALLLRVSETGGLHRSKFVCRPGHDAPDMGRCFRVMVGRRDLERIETALPEEPFLPRPLPERPAPVPVLLRHLHADKPEPTA